MKKAEKEIDEEINEKIKPKKDLFRKQETLSGSGSTSAQTGLVTFVLVRRLFRITPDGSVDATYE